MFVDQTAKKTPLPVETSRSATGISEEQGLALAAGGAVGAMGWLGSYVVTVLSSATPSTLVVSGLVPGASVGLFLLGVAKGSTVLKIAGLTLWPSAVIASKAIGYEVSVLTPVAGLAVGLSVAAVSAVALGILAYKFAPKLRWKNLMGGFNQA